ncbi:MarR family winged helix-turn-helix transcriptional regulator [Geodermatophilus sp. YIM 151500]|uniref:MarR family winged helix-turn-helix transcriptional regulator n=1 Tax=Geodermatophilus sp. YIM 151500 TaxID=2984531 RepID=UPI0021E4148B|nr:MarR family winged helix-turn-helix transcriptional regulator [Geodermatophilus sp. YIM 151500]MCV2491586.1 MarR family winged helix-turn-helix transcriptional regulator [Geodermatophilus sp. YIM 151500]
MMDSEGLSAYPLPLLVDVVNRVLPDAIDRALKDAGYTDVTRAHGAVFDALDPGGSRITEMAARMRITKQAMGELCAALEQRGYLQRRPDPADGRAKLVALTAKGEQLVDVARGALRDLDEQWIDHLGGAEARALRSSLTKLVRRFAAEHLR